MKLLYLLLAALPASMACSCVQPECPTTQPAKCECENAFQVSCNKACNATVPPFQQDCNNILPEPQICGSRGLPECPADRPACLNTPEQLAEGCTTAADCPGFCVSLDGDFCGGFGGFPCPTGQTCVDDPSDDCGPPFWADCAGVCVNFPNGQPGNQGGKKY